MFVYELIISAHFSFVSASHQLHDDNTPNIDFGHMVYMLNKVCQCLRAILVDFFVISQLFLLPHFSVGCWNSRKDDSDGQGRGSHDGRQVHPTQQCHSHCIFSERCVFFKFDKFFVVCFLLPVLRM